MTEDSTISLPWPEWRVEEKLGQGSFGTVYRIVKEEYGNVSKAAVKVIRFPANRQEAQSLKTGGISIRSYYKDIITDYVGEIRMMESLKSAPNIVGIEDYKIVENRDPEGWIIYIRMELLTNLNQYREWIPMKLSDVIKLGKDISRALMACRKKKIIHRDIKPGNVFVTEFGDYKLGDFGEARNLDRTQSGLSRRGTEIYMAPEILRGDDHYDSTVDLYSLGIMMYQMANNGRIPYLPAQGNITARQVEEAKRARLNGAYLPDPPMGDKRFGDILRIACNIDPKQRYRTPEEFYQALTDYERGRAPGRDSQRRSEEPDPEKTVRAKQQVPPKKTAPPPRKTAPPPQKKTTQSPQKTTGGPAAKAGEKKKHGMLNYIVIAVVVYLIARYVGQYWFSGQSASASLAEAQTNVESQIDMNLLEGVPVTNYYSDIKTWLGQSGYAYFDQPLTAETYDYSEKYLYLADPDVDFRPLGLYEDVDDTLETTSTERMRYKVPVNSTEEGETLAADICAVFDDRWEAVDGVRKNRIFSKKAALVDKSWKEHDAISGGNRYYHVWWYNKSDAKEIWISVMADRIVDVNQLYLDPQLIDEMPLGSRDEALAWMDEKPYEYKESTYSELPGIDHLHLRYDLDNSNNFYENVYWLKYGNEAIYVLDARKKNKPKLYVAVSGNNVEQIRDRLQAEADAKTDGRSYKVEVHDEKDQECYLIISQ